MIFGGFRSFFLAVLVAELLPGSAGVAVAGGGPENVLLVVNSNSTDSLTIANHYVQLRRIAPVNVMTLPWDPDAQTSDVDTFRKQILIPVLATIERRRLAQQIDYIIYSSDFPWGISVHTDVKKHLENAGKASEDGTEPKVKPAWPKQLTKVAAINGLTYLYQAVLSGNPSYVQLRSNYYARRPLAMQRDEPTLAFDAFQQFGPHGELLDTGGRRYMLSMVLAVTAGRGNTVPEVLGYLNRSAAADGTHPRGTIYFAKNNDIRSKVRHAAFPEASRQLAKLGIASKIVDGKIPRGKNDVQGAVMGTASFNWKSSGSTILPGAICEHFTSFGGRMTAGAGQTPLSELLRYGAAGASGTVTEPYAIAEKFPTAMVQVHYARGCSLAEAFYQTIYGPYQLLIVGDPLCRPWANIPRVSCEEIRPGATITGKLSICPTTTVPGGGEVDRFELFVDGLLATECDALGTLELDTTGLGDGHHELRVVAFEAGPIRSQGRLIVPVTTANHGREISVSATPSGKVTSGDAVVLSVASPDSYGTVVLHNSRLLGRVDGEQGTVKIDTSTLGTGPVRLRVVGLGHGGPADYVHAKPIEFTVE